MTFQLIMLSLGIVLIIEGVGPFLFPNRWRAYLKDIGITTSRIYVTALASTNPQDKADWIEDKIDNEGYEDIYFADDSQRHVDGAMKMLRRKNVKWRVQHIKH